MNSIERPEAARRAVIFGCQGPRLLDQERAFFWAARPSGFILFKRNCDSPEQVRDLVAALCEAADAADALILIDQEGGRVARLGPPHWRRPPAGAVFDRLAGRDLELAERAIYLNARLMAAEMVALGINVDCYPPLDLGLPSASTVIGDRALGADPSQIAALGRAACNGLLDGGVLPVIKHIPGHGRAQADSHVALPIVTTPRDELERTDFAPFRALADMPIGMTAHIKFDALDPKWPATLSRNVIEQVIRRTIGFDGLLLCDDISMQALSGTRGECANAALEAGCDVVLHCNGVASEMEEIARMTPPLNDAALRRLNAAKARLKPPPTFDHGALLAEFDALIGTTAMV
ncbi:MAG: beta-N-acetylhexosaminidase [Alphaproteobacteria bacterium]|nr:beta-N-acetylhexosaminidase [Alphaproteobacteria bacterium]